MFLVWKWQFQGKSTEMSTSRLRTNPTLNAGNITIHFVLFAQPFPKWDYQTHKRKRFMSYKTHVMIYLDTHWQVSPLPQKSGRSTEWNLFRHILPYPILLLLDFLYSFSDLCNGQDLHEFTWEWILSMLYWWANGQKAVMLCMKLKYRVSFQNWPWKRSVCCLKVSRIKSNDAVIN